MSRFEQYLLNLGYIRFYMTYEDMIYKKCDNYNLDINGNITYSYFHHTEEDILQAIEKGLSTFSNQFPKYYFSKCIIYGYSYENKPPTLIYPRPRVIVCKYDTNGSIINDKFVSDDAVNLVLASVPPKEIFKALYDKSIVFNFDQT